MTNWSTQEREAHVANELSRPVSGREVDRILWNRGRDTIDEIVVNDCTVHLEQMTDTYYWMAVYKDDATFVLNLHHDGRKPLLCTGYDDTVPGKWHWDRDDEHR